MSQILNSVFIFRSILAGLVFALAVLLVQSLTDEDTNLNRRPSLLEQTQDIGTRPQNQDVVSYAQAVQSAAPAVVNVYSTRFQDVGQHPLFQDPTFKQFFGEAPNMPESRAKNSLGSGVIIDSGGFILTNAHVVADADEIRISLQDGRQALARLIGDDVDTDLAVLKIDLENLPVISLGDSSQLNVGDVVLAIGNPYDFGQTVTQGIVSATGRNRLGITTFEDFIQTDADINPGNSGGALIDAYGRLVGINTAIITKSGGGSGIGFANPINLALDVMWQLLAHGKVVRGWIGIEARSLNQEMIQQTGLATGGVLIAGVLAQGPAHDAGLMPGDIITHINSKAIRDANLAIHAISELKPGTEADLTILRGWDEFNVIAKVAQRPKFRQPRQNGN